LFMRENKWILKRARALGLYAAQLISANKPEAARKLLENMLRITGELRRIKLHHRKIQMLVFPYLEKRGITAVPRVLWGREDKIITDLRDFYEKATEALKTGKVELMGEAGRLALDIAREIGEVVFRENKILYQLYTLYSVKESGLQ